MDLLALSNSAANFLLYFAMSSQVTIWLSPITFDLFSLFYLVWLGCWYIRQMDPPTPLLHPWCILSWTSHNLSNQFLFDCSLSLPRAFFFPFGSGLGGSGWRHVEIKAGNSCYLIYNYSQHKMALLRLLNLTIILHSPPFLSLSIFAFVFVFPMYLSLHLSFLSLLWLPWHFPKVFYGIHAFRHGSLLYFY